MRRAAAAASSLDPPAASPASRQILGVSVPSNREHATGAAPGASIVSAAAPRVTGIASATPAAFNNVRRDGARHTAVSPLSAVSCQLSGAPQAAPSFAAELEQMMA